MPCDDNLMLMAALSPDMLKLCRVVPSLPCIYALEVQTGMRSFGLDGRVAPFTEKVSEDVDVIVFVMN